MELFRLIGKLAIEGVDEAKNRLTQTADTAQKTEGKMSSSLKKIGAAVASAFAVKKIVDFSVALTKASVQAYADYEQLTGGIDTLFNDSYDKVIQYANNAYKTAGMSANAYMETVTSFSASLLQSLGDDTAAAAEKADMAITDMADNANKMGTSMESIQNAYQGFAKQNYTMLDNLKLGYGGTKEEMQRLLDKANELNAQHGVYTDYQIDSYADIVDAIHVVQEEMGITGATADEAVKTISGSAAAMKAAWQNLLVGFAAGDQDLDLLINNLVQSLTTVAKNVVPRVITTFKSIGSVLVENIIGSFTENTPAILEKGRETLTSFAKGFSDSLPVMLNKVTDVILNVIEYLKENAPKFIAMGVEFIINLGAGLIKAIPTIVNSVGKVTISLVDAFFNTDWSAVGKAVIEGIGKGLTAAGDMLVKKGKEVAGGLLNGIKNFFGIHSPSTVMREQVGKQLALGVAEGIAQNATKVSKEAEEMGDKILDAAEQTLKEYKRQHNMSINDEIEYWAEIIEQTEKGTKARISAEDKYYDALEQQKEELKEAQQEYENYVDSIMNQTNLFDKFTKNNEKGLSSKGLLKNLRSQVEGLEDYYEVMQNLGEKIGGTNLFAEIKEMGTESLAELELINSMTESQLEEYVELYEKKFALAKQGAAEMFITPTIYNYTPATSTYQLDGVTNEETVAKNTALQQYFNESLSTVIGQQSTLLQGILNAIVGLSNKEMTTIVQVDSQAIAKAVFKPLQDITKQHGRSLITT